MSTLDKLKTLRRPVREVTLPGGDTVHVRDLTVGELRRIDERAAEDADGDPEQVQVWTAVRLAAAALAEPDGSAAFPAQPTKGELAPVEELTTSQIEAIVTAAVRTKDHAKN